MKSLLFQIISLSFFSSLSLQATCEVKSFDSTDVQKVKIESDSGSIKITSTEVNTPIEIKADKEKFTSETVLNMEKRDGIIKITAKNKSKHVAARVHFDVRLPRSLPLEVNLGTGSVNIKKRMGKVTIKAGILEGIVEECLGDVEIECGKGTLELNNNDTNLDINIGMGVVKAAYEKIKAAIKPMLKVHAGTLELDIKAPHSSKIYLNHTGVPSLTSLKNSFRQHSPNEADFLIYTKLAHGKVSLSPREGET